MLVSCPFSFNRLINKAAGVHPQFFTFLHTVESDIVSAGITSVYQADQAHYEAPKKMSAAEQALDDLAEEVRLLYENNDIDPEQVLKTAANHYRTEEFLRVVREAETPVRDESDQFYLDPDRSSTDDDTEEEEEEEADNSDASAADNQDAPAADNQDAAAADNQDAPAADNQDAPAPEVPYTPIGRNREDVDDRRIALRFNPGLEDHEDTRFNWVSSGWHLPDPEPLSLEQRTRLFASEDINEVAVNGCLACKKPVVNAITLKCAHMICLPCFEKPSIKKCPHPNCDQRKRFAAVSNCATLIHLRKDDDDLRVRSREARFHPSSAPVEESTQEEIEHDRNSIDTSLRALGVRDPYTYRASLRSKNRIQSRQDLARADERYRAEGRQAIPNEVCWSSFYAVCCSRLYFINT